ncbi:holo-ACP synthase [Larkinella punicea]|uniref:Holo-[acyl-carrier-protein] synthase n=1 Tax=Larkinella punicea TaxID=2315727 RepID=A0A368JIN1_9BACT|nr:holo-ACP synthase [Larkinella punicea]RCR67518.1 holo-[acyl-carrier-protein] synthase [Larkinella punicea]
MIIGIGCDIVDHKISESLEWDSKPHTINRILSDEEMMLYDSHKTLNFIAGRFAAKEAILKCLGTGMQDGISLRQIQILKSEDGNPIVQLMGQAKQISDNMGVDAWHLSISHCASYSIAFAIAEKK